MKLSIIIPVYNVEKYISICLESLLNQDLNKKDYEILIINDGSTDRSKEIAEDYSRIHCNVRLYNQENGGVGSARNRGLDLAKGNFLYFLDPDDYVLPNVLKTLIEFAEEKDLDILTFISKQTTSSNLTHSSPCETKSIIIDPIYRGQDYIANYNYRNEVWWYIIKREFIKDTEIKFIEDRWMEDAILTAELFLKANKIAHLHLDAHRHLVVEGSAMTSKEPSHYLRVIDDNRNAAIVFESLIEDLIEQKANRKCIERLRTRQQSFVFFMMVRMLKSTMNLEQVKIVMDSISNTNAYPLQQFYGKDYKGLVYFILVKLFNNTPVFYSLFRGFNPLSKLKK